MRIARLGVCIAAVMLAFASLVAKADAYGNGSGRDGIFAPTSDSIVNAYAQVMQALSPSENVIHVARIHERIRPAGHRD